jgi:hypothetical protein
MAIGGDQILAPNPLKRQNFSPQAANAPRLPPNRRHGVPTSSRYTPAFIAAEALCALERRLHDTKGSDQRIETPDVVSTVGLPGSTKSLSSAACPVV